METHTSAFALLVLCSALISTGNFSPLQSSLNDADLSRYFGKSEATDHEIVNVNQQEGEGSLQYNFEAFGRDLSMILNPVDGLFNGASHQCHYEGKLVDGSESTIAISTCNGLSGYISVDGEDYFIAKLSNDHAMKLMNAEDPHIVFKGKPSGASGTEPSERTTKLNRKRRETSDRPIHKYVEINVYVDEHVYAKRADSTKDATLSYFNQVRSLFADESLMKTGDNVKLIPVVNRITTFQQSQDGLESTSDTDVYLSNFCAWQQSSLEGSSDVSVLITGLDLQITDNYAITGKASDIGGACDPTRRCVIAEDHGEDSHILPGVMFTISHEIAHILGIHHDGGVGDCQNKKNIMSPSSPTGKNAYKWSTCSSDDLADFLASDASTCLDNVPAVDDLLNPSRFVLTGSVRGATEQCWDKFPGTDTRVAVSVENTEAVCMDLLCDTIDSVDVTADAPALAGTKCDGHGFCSQGRCVRDGNTRQCSGQDCTTMWYYSDYGTCDNCLQTRVGTCVQIFDDGTVTQITDLNQCPVPDTLTQSCNCDLPECCVATYSYSVGNYGACSATCGIGSQTRTVVCMDTNNQITVDDVNCQNQGLTKPVDNVACSNYVFCQYQTGTYSACSVSCGAGVQTRSLSCVDTSGSVDTVVDSNNCVNAGLTEPSTVITCNDGECVNTYIFIVSTFSACSVTCGSGVQTRDVSCALVGSSQIVDNSFCVDAGLSVPETAQVCTPGPTCPVPVYTFTTGGFGTCTVTCGGGVQTRSVTCIVITTEVVVDDVFCTSAGLERPVSDAVCNSQDCPSYAYLTTAWGDCSVTCEVGIETRDTPCISLGATNLVVDSSFCIASGLTPPDSVRSCEINVACPNRYVYSTGNYGACSVTCGAGVAVRDVQCRDTENNNVVVDDALCTGTRPVSFIDCEEAVCTSGMYQYITNAWMACDCDGLQTRVVICIIIDGTQLQEADNQECIDNGLTMPPEVQVCTPPNTCSTPQWSFSAWSTCSETCGVGIETRTVFCVDNTNTIVNDVECDPTTKPTDSQACDTGTVCPSTYMFFSNTWSACSVTCGEGVETRVVTCYQISGTFMEVDDVFCAGQVKPDTSRPCPSLPPCAGVWASTDWSTCSASCGVGNQDRFVNCYRTKGSNELLDEAECTDTKPPTTRVCYLEDCPLLPGCDETIDAVAGQEYVLSSPGFPSNYPDDYICNNLITTTEGRIEITFTEFNTEESDTCEYDLLTITDDETRTYCGLPEVPFTVTSSGNTFLTSFTSDSSVNRRGFTATYRVLPTDDIQYITSEFSECSVTCGDGVRSRSVTCFNNGEEVDDAICIGLERPAETEVCTLEDCPAADFCGNDTVRTVEGEITSPGFPESYDIDLECVNIIQAPLNNIIEFSAIFFDVEDSVDCSSDAVTFSEDNDDVAFCGSESGVIFTSVSNQVNVTFYTDSVDTNDIGYIIQFEFIPIDVNQCDALLTSDQEVFSPNYPGEYGIDEDCSTTIYDANDLCIEIIFDDIQIEMSDNCESDYLEIRDLTNAFLDKRICGNPEEVIFRSFGSSVLLTFVSDDAVNEVGYHGDVRFVDCPIAVYSVGEFSDCSVSCGGGVRTRSVECVDSNDNVLPAAICEGDAPIAEEECASEECPSCDAIVTDTGLDSYVIESPNYPLPYDDEANCTYTILSPVSKCILLSDISFDLEDVNEEGECENDYVEIFDVVYPTIRQVNCGSDRRTFNSLSSQVQQRFITNDNVTAEGFSSFVFFVDCPTYAYLPGEWSECSATCGDGEQTRTVDCWFLAMAIDVDDAFCSGEKPPTSQPCYEEDCPNCDVEITEEVVFSNLNEGEDIYLANQDCVTTVIAPADMCISFFVLNYEFEEATDGLCLNDYFILTDPINLDFNQTFCGDGAFVAFQTAGNTALITFHSDDEEQFEGYQILPNFIECTPYFYAATDFSDCDRTCDIGMQTRTLYCIDVESGSTVDDDNCDNIEPPPTTQSCNLGPCPECDEEFLDGGVLQRSNYESNLNCRAEIVGADGSCIQISKVIFSLPDRVDGECWDSFQIFDIGNDAPRIEYCGDEFEGFTSRSNQVDVRFISNNDTESGSYTLIIDEVECPAYGYVSGEFDDCTRTCGGGTQMRTVECQELDTDTVVDDDMCDDAKPEDSQECNLQDCPPCGEVVTDNNQIFTDPSGANADYDPLLDCNYEISAEDGSCPLIVFTTFDLEPLDGGICNDFIEFDQPGFENTFYQFCGSETNFFQAASQEVTMNFQTDDSSEFEGFSANNIHSGCPDFTYAVGEFEDCSVTCGEGYQVRELLCIDLSDNSEVDLAECEDRPLPRVINETCNLEECPGCDSDIIFEGASASMEFTFDGNEECRINITSVNGECVSIYFQEVNLPSDCEENYVEFYDPTAPWLNGIKCDDAAIDTFNSQSNTVILEFENDGSAAVTDGAKYFVFTNTCPVYGYVITDESICSVTCGEGTLTRVFDCQNLETGESVDDTECSGEIPSSTEDCERGDCPSCDMNVTETGLITLNNYANDEDCTYTISFSTCFSLFFVNFDLEPLNDDGECVDYLKVTDSNYPLLNRTFCGEDDADDWTSASNEGVIYFRSNDNITDDGFQILITESDCAEYAYSVGEFSECPCGSGESVQTRDVKCIDLSDGSTVDDANCADLSSVDDTQTCQATGPCDDCFEEFTVTDSTFQLTSEQYVNDYDCTYNISSDEGTCLNLGIISFRLEESENCENDFVRIVGEGVDERLCGNVASSTSFQFRTNEAQIFISTNGNVTDDGFRFFVTEIVCPEYGFVVGDYDECSKTCDGGVQTRTVECQQLSTGAVQGDESMCEDEKPDATSPCNEFDCPVCLMEFTPDSGNLITAESLDNNTDCYYRSTTDEGQCISVVITQTNLNEPDDEGNCTTDYIEVRDLNNPEFLVVVCGDSNIATVIEASSSNSVEILVHVEDGTDKSALFFFYEADCRSYEQTIDGFGECSETCGGGVRTRDVNCVDIEDQIEVEDFYCFNLVQINETEKCAEVDCPECGDIILTESGELESPGDDEYPADEDCSYVFIRTDSSICILMTIDEFDIPDGPSDDCGDYLSIGNYELCDKNLTGVQFVSSEIATTVRFVSDEDDVVGEGFSLRFEPIACPEFEFTVGEFGNCSADCEEGTRTRDVDCLDDDGEVVEDTMCAGIKPDLWEACNISPCAENFYEFVSGEYGDCMTTANVGFCAEERTVECQNNVTSVVVDDSFCDNKPDVSTSCTCPEMTTVGPTDATTVAADMTTAAMTTQTQTECGGVFSESDTTGTFTSPNYPANYPADVYCVWNFTLPVGYKVVFSIQAFDVEGPASGTPCTALNSDFLEFSDTAEIPFALCIFEGELPVGINRASADSDFSQVTFQSNSAIQDTGFTINYNYIIEA